MNSRRGRWAVTGGAGRIGQAVRDHLTASGTPLRSLDVVRPQSSGPDDQVRICDVRDLVAVEAAVESCVGVIHLGGLSDEADFHDLAEVNIIGTYHVLEAARRQSVARVIYASSNRVTGMYPVETMVSPEMPARPDGFYGVSKVAGEALCRLYSDKFDVSTISIRIGSYEDSPTSQRELRTWLSPADALHAFDAAMVTDVHTATFYAVSANAQRWWTIDEGRALGFLPANDAATASSLHSEPFAHGSVQAGAYADADYSLSRQRSPGNTEHS